jgi:hypothetical protein
LAFHKVPTAGGVVLSKEEHEAYKKFLAARGVQAITLMRKDGGLDHDMHGKSNLE